LTNVITCQAVGVIFNKRLLQIQFLLLLWMSAAGNKGGDIQCTQSKHEVQWKVFANFMQTSFMD